MTSTTYLAVPLPTVGADEDAWGTINNAAQQSWDTEFATRGIGVAQGRLTATTATPVTTSDVTAVATLYYALYTGNLISLYDGTSWRPKVFTELSLALDSNSGHTGYHQSGKNFDLYVFNDAGTIRLGTGPAWTSDTARGTGAGTTELERYLGAWVNKNAITARFGSASGNTVSVSARQATYVGTIRCSADGQTEDSVLKRFIWNTYNRVNRTLIATDLTDSWSYTLTTYRQANAATANKVEMVRGLNEDAVSAELLAGFSNSTIGVLANVAIGLDSTTASSATLVSVTATPVANIGLSSIARYAGLPGLGYHYLAWLERSAASGTTTWYGDAGSATITAQSGLAATGWW